MVQTFKKKETIVEVEQYTGDNNPFGAIKFHKCNYRMCPLCGGDDHEHIYIDTSDGGETIGHDYYILKNSSGVLSACHPDVFPRLYEPVAAPPPDQPIPEEAGIPKMSDELAAMSDVAALEYGKENGVRLRSGDIDFYNGADLTNAFEKGSSWMYRQMREGLEEARHDIAIYKEWKEKAEAERDAIRKAFDEQTKELEKYRK